jgi:hypothetical protein
LVTCAPAAAPAAAVAAEEAVEAAAAGCVVGGGEGLPCPGKLPPVEPSSWALLVAALRTGLEPAALSAAAKAWPLALSPAELAAAPPACAASLEMGACEITGIAFIPNEIASDVPSTAPRPTIPP